MLSDILIITTGGTIGALPYQDPINPPKFAIMPQDKNLVLDWINSNYNFSSISLPPKDSKDIDNNYRQKIVENIGDFSKVIITHGTDTILETGKYIHELSLDKTIFLVGSMTPLSNGEESDGWLNLSFSINKLSETSTGVYIVLTEWTQNNQFELVANTRLYPLTQKWKKVYVEDGRYNQLQPGL